MMKFLLNHKFKYLLLINLILIIYYLKPTLDDVTLYNIITIILGIIITWDVYPLWEDYQWRYLFKKSYITGTKLDKYFSKLDGFIHQTGDFEGHIACSKYKIEFIQDILKTHQPIRIAEIGFNAGHSSTIFLTHNNNITVTSFDLCDHQYSNDTQQFLKQKFPNRLEIICGDSRETVPKYQGEKFDLILVDGGHESNLPYLDLKNTIEYLGKKGSLVIMDDTHYSYIIGFLLRFKYKLTVDQAWKQFLNKQIKPVKHMRGMSLGIII